MRNFLLALFLTSIVAAPLSVTASTVDLSISASSIRFSKSTLVSGDSVRIYATINNVGDVDSTAQVFFYQGARLIGKSQPVSVLADGGKDDVFVDFTVPDGSFNIRAVLQGSNPADEYPANDEATTPLFRVVLDTDRDGVIDEEDNCVDASNADQADLDNDGKGDVCDGDIDGDGVANTDDDYPRDPKLSKLVVVTYGPTTEPTPEPEQVVATPSPKPVVSVTPVVAPKAEATAAPVATPEPENDEAEASPDAPAPAPEVQGVQTEGEETVHVALDFSGLGSGKPVQSSMARFTYTQVGWRTYSFTAIPPVGSDGYTYAWEFGDGATSVQETIEHTFPSPGVYTVTLGVVDASGALFSDAEAVRVSFFHLGNPLLLATIAVLVAIMLGLLMMIVRLRRGEEL